MSNIIDLIDSYIERDPAAKGRIETFLTSPGLHALGFYRASNFFWAMRLYIIARIISYFGRFFTGIEIHPGSKIGNKLFIDHGMGVVIGETSIIGDYVTLYHGVTLGGVSPSINSEDQVNKKRHPTLEDGAIIGSGAQILGPVIIGKDSRVGSNSVVTKNVEANKSVVGVASRYTTKIKDSEKKFSAYAVTKEEEDPSGIVDNLVKENDRLSKKIEEIEKKLNLKK